MKTGGFVASPTPEMKPARAAFRLGLLAAQGMIDAGYALDVAQLLEGSRFDRARAFNMLRRIAERNNDASVWNDRFDVPPFGVRD